MLCKCKVKKDRYSRFRSGHPDHASCIVFTIAGVKPQSLLSSPRPDCPAQMRKKLCLIHPF